MAAERRAAREGQAHGRRVARLQIRVSVDEHMQELYGWLAAMPATLRGRELLAQARLARSLATVRAAGMLQPLSTASGGSEPSPTDAPQVGGAALSEDAARQTRARLQVGFLAAVPPLS